MNSSQKNQQQDSPSIRQAATQLIRERIQKLQPLNKTSQPTEKPEGSLIQHFWDHHKDHPSPQHAWQRFYEGLDDKQKQQLWDEYHGLNSGASAQPNDFEAAQEQSFDKQHSTKPLDKLKDSKAGKSMADVKSELLSRVKRSDTPRDPRLPDTSWRSHLKPLLFSSLVALFVMGLNYNELVIAQVKQYITPSATEGTPVIIDPNADIHIGPEPLIIIPKINVNVPVVYDIPNFDESQIQSGLERGVVHYGGTPFPGEAGNNVIVGHSSNNFFNSGKYKFAFVLLDRLDVGDTFLLHYNGVRYVYKVSRKEITSPSTSDPLTQSLISSTATPTATLITCTPPGTSWNRLIIQGEQISPEPSHNKAPTNNIAEEAKKASPIIPGNSQTLFDRFFDWLFGND